MGLMDVIKLKAMCLVNSSNSYLSAVLTEELLDEDTDKLLDYIDKTKLSKNHTQHEIYARIKEDAEKQFRLVLRALDLHYIGQLDISSEDHDVANTTVTVNTKITNLVREVINRFDENEYVDWRERESTVATVKKAVSKQLVRLGETLTSAQIDHLVDLEIKH